MRRLVLALPLALACSGPERAASRAPATCKMQIPDTYTEQVIQAIYDRLRPRIVGPSKGTVRLFLRITTAGQLVDGKVSTAPSPEIGELALAAAYEAAPYPDLTRGGVSCVFSAPLLVWIVYDVPRDCEAVPAVDAYLERIGREVHAAGAFAGLPRGSASIVLRISAEGELLDTSPTESLDAEAFAAITSALAAASPFEPPPPDLRDCLVDQPVLLQTVVP